MDLLGTQDETCGKGCNNDKQYAFFNGGLTNGTK